MSRALARSVNSIKGLRFFYGEVRQIHFTGRLSFSVLKDLLQVLKKSGEEFAFYDELYPSPSDPGAYFSYSPADREGRWQMTFGNHGWSGGIYEIKNDVICCQLLDLVTRGLLKDIRLDRVAFFSHYGRECDSDNRAMNEEILALHGRDESRSAR